MMTKQITLRLPEELYEQFQAIAEREGFSFNSFALQAFIDYLNEHQLDHSIVQTEQHA